MFDAAAQREIAKIAAGMPVPAAALLAVAEVESGGQVFARVDDRDMPLIRWEGHYFYRLLSGEKRTAALKKGLASENGGGIPNPKGQAARYALLNRARQIDDAAALQSCSWGLGQVMGANFASLGYADVQALVDEAVSGVVGQVALMARFIRTRKLIDELQNLDWPAFARAYNGAQYGDYDQKMAKAHQRWSAALGSAAEVVSTLAGYRLAMGARGSEVVDLQVKLRRIGYFLHADGDFGPATRAAILSFQRDYDLAQTGVVDFTVWSRIQSLQGG